MPKSKEVETRSRKNWEGGNAASPQPAQWPYWLMSIFCGAIFLPATYGLAKELILRPFQWEGWVLLFLVVALFGAPTLLGILRIRQIQQQQFYKPIPQSGRLSPVGGYIVGGILFALMGGALFFSIQRNLEFQKNMLPASGVVTRWVYHSSYRAGYTVAEVRYQTPDGKIHIEECSNHGFGFDLPKVNETVPIFYNRYNPREFRFADRSIMWSDTYMYGMILLFMMVGLILRLYYKKITR